jgi:LemA protein
METILWILLIIPVAIVLWAISVYNGLIKLKNRTDEAWSDIDVQLKRRYNLIPNLVETVKGYATHERELFEKVTKARSAAMNAGTIKEHGQTENMLSGALKSLFAVAENYPDLKASQNFMELQKELSDTENKIQAARRFYNGNVRDFNIKIQTFPNNVIAGALKFTDREFFEIEEEAAREPVAVKF